MLLPSVTIPEEPGGSLHIQDQPGLYSETLSQAKPRNFPSVHLSSINYQFHVRYLGGLCTTDNLGRVWPDTGPEFVFPN